MPPLDELLNRSGRLTLAGVPEGLDARVLADLTRASATGTGAGMVVHVAADDARLSLLRQAVAFFAPDIEVITLPAWDCLPYDRASPNPELSARRMAALAALATHRGRARLVLTTVNAAVQRMPPKTHVAGSSLLLARRQGLALDALTAFLSANGYIRTTMVTEPGEFAVRGGLVDLYPAGAGQPLRVDFFGDEIEGLRHFDPLDQRSTDSIDRFTLVPAGELSLSAAAIRRFRQGYVALFGTVIDEDPLYHAISEGRRHQGAEHWLPLFYEDMASLADYLPSGTVVVLDPQAEDAVKARHAAIADYYESRRAARSGATLPYKPLPPERLYLMAEEWQALLAGFAIRQLSPFQVPEAADVIALDGRAARDFAPERQQGANVYEALIGHIKAEAAAGRRTLLVSYSPGARDRLAHVLADHGLRATQAVASALQLATLAKDAVGLAVLPLAHGFVTPDLNVITEQDILGDRLVRRARRAKRAENFLTEAASLAPGDLVVHAEHGIGRYEGLQTIEVAGAPHDCVWLTYAGGDRLFVPVENIEVLSRYGSEGSEAALDRLGGAGWQGRKARLRARIRDMAEALIKVAAARALRQGLVIETPQGLYDEFCARFPYVETDDQLSAVADVLADLASGRPMDRLICGDVGFGKTEVALRAAFAAVMTGCQVAVICPTTLLARQHSETFRQRFLGLPVRIAQLSRLVGARDASGVRQGLADGSLDIVVGTHALLGKSVAFKRLGLVIVDEEQHFGVAHKERLKALRADVHVLTLSATPIPRTLQLALSGIRDLSLIATPPVDRLAVRTFVSPLDELVVREALLREHYRGGQSFFVVPRIADLEEAARFLQTHVPEVRFITAHGQMPPRAIEDVMNAFYDGRYEVLLSTSIIESGLDIPRANTLIVHHADRFGLAQLYQLRGRVGRAKLRAYAYLTTAPGKPLSEAAHKRLQVLQSLDSLGAGFTLASHDMDIRGAGNLLGEEQSGHIREVGVELYQSMLEEAVAAARGGGQYEDEAEQDWSPQINVGATVLIPESYVPDLDLRMALYRRIANLDNRAALDGLAAEMIDRFGPLPEAVNHLFRIIEIKSHAKAAGIDRIEAGTKGITIGFRGDRFANPAGMVAFIASLKNTAKLRPDHRLVLLVPMETVAERLAHAQQLVRGLAQVANAAQAA
ncbi:MAG: transcription-repair coupling factor [Pseudomonadota bacterium]